MISNSPGDIVPIIFIRHERGSDDVHVKDLVKDFRVWTFFLAGFSGRWEFNNVGGGYACR